MAAILACGPRALLGHRSAAALWDLAPAGGARIDVTATGRSRRGRAGIALHRIRNLDPEDRTERDGIPTTTTTTTTTTTVARTLLDLAEVVNSHRLGRAFEQAERLQLLDLNFVARARLSSAIAPVTPRSSSPAIAFCASRRIALPKSPK